ncbi:MAG: hypothetical protein Q8R47_05415 [Nanoarchaeota archaeon]|nr:hypothetical protein [Nanoarchaeota archaeon]
MAAKIHRSRRAPKPRKNKDISPQMLMAMITLVLVVSLLSAGMYVYAFYGNSNHTTVQKSFSESPVIEEKPAASGMATIQIIKPPVDSKN